MDPGSRSTSPSPGQASDAAARQVPNQDPDNSDSEAQADGAEEEYPAPGPPMFIDLDQMPGPSGMNADGSSSSRQHFVVSESDDHAVPGPSQPFNVTSGSNGLASLDLPGPSHSGQNDDSQEGWAASSSGLERQVDFSEDNSMESVDDNQSVQPRPSSSHCHVSGNRVSPQDPNLSSVARYSPTFQNAQLNISYNPPSSSSNATSSFSGAVSPVPSQGAISSSASSVNNPTSPVIVVPDQELPNNPQPTPAPAPAPNIHFQNSPGPSSNPLHGEISNPPSPLGGMAAPVPVGSAPTPRPESPQAGPSGIRSNKRSMEIPDSPRPGPSGSKRFRVPAEQSSTGGRANRFAPGSSSEAAPVVPRFKSPAPDSDSDSEPGSPIHPPLTPADNYLISSSTGLMDSIPPTPVDIYGDNDLSVPSPNPATSQVVPVNRRVDDVDDMIDSTVDSSGLPFTPSVPKRHESGEAEVGDPCQSSHDDTAADDDISDDDDEVDGDRSVPENVSASVSEDVSASGPEDVSASGPEDVSASGPEDVSASGPEEVSASVSTSSPNVMTSSLARAGHSRQQPMADSGISRAGYSRQQPAADSGISQSGQVDRGDFRLVPNPPDSWPPPRKPFFYRKGKFSAANRGEPSKSSKRPVPNSSRGNGSNNLREVPTINGGGQPAIEGSQSMFDKPSGSGGAFFSPPADVPVSSSSANYSLENLPPGPSSYDPSQHFAAMSSEVASAAGPSRPRQPSRRDNLEGILPSLNGFFVGGSSLDPTLGEFDDDPGQPIDLEDIQLQKLLPDFQRTGQETPTSTPSFSSANSRFVLEQEISLNHINKDSSSAAEAFPTDTGHSRAAQSHQISSDSLNIALAFSGIPSSLKQDEKHPSSSQPSTSSSTAPSTSHSSILESMTGPLSKRLRTLHTLQQQQSAKDNGTSSTSTAPTPSNGESGKSGIMMEILDSPRNGNEVLFSLSDILPPDQEGQRNQGNSLPPSEHNGSNGSASSSSDQPRVSGSSNDPPPPPQGGGENGGGSNGDGPFTHQTFTVTIETIGTTPIKPKKFFQQKSAADLRLSDDPFLKDDPLRPGIVPGLALMREKRALSKRQWCESCNDFCAGEKCAAKNRIKFSISDRPVISRSRASLPSDYLFFREMKESGEEVTGVFTKRTIPKACRFGPIEGRLARPEHQEGDKMLLLIEKENDVVKMDVSDEENSNWMRFVRPASSFGDQNLSLDQEDDGHLYFTSTRAINAKQELKVWYSPAYAKRRGLPLLEPKEEEQKAFEDDENLWPCFECNKKFERSEDLQRHLNEHETSQPLESRKPKKKISQRNKRIKIHRTDDGANKAMHRCPICPRHFERQYSLKRHVILHQGDKRYDCDECNLQFSHPYNLTRHKKKSHSVDPSGEYTRCPTCGLWFKLNAVYRVHMFNHHPEKEKQNLTVKDALEQAGRTKDVGDEMKFQCPDCELQFDTWLDLVDHSTGHGQTVLPGVKAQMQKTNNRRSAAKPFKCELCYKAFASDDRLQRHMAVHGSDETKPLMCLECGKRFLNNSALACHVKIHSDEKKTYDCPICGQDFQQVVALKEHIHVHRENGVYTCPHCAKKFPEYALVRKHIRAFHAEKRFPCPHCEKSFTGADKLKAHIVKHSDVRDFLCNECGKQFKRKDKLKEHHKRMHTGERAKANGDGAKREQKAKDKFVPKVAPNDFHRFIYKCHKCFLGFKRRGMLVNHLAKRHPEISPESVPELNLPILKTKKDYYCQYCHKVYKSSSKRKVHILKVHPGAALPVSLRDKSVRSGPNPTPANDQPVDPTFSATVGSVTSQPHNCQFCHKQYASRAKLLQHQRKKHKELMPADLQTPRSCEPSAQPDPQPAAAEVRYILPSEPPLVHVQEFIDSLDYLITADVKPPREEVDPLAPGPSMPPGLEYRTADGEVVQLTRVSQSEALRLASSGATVIHVPSGNQQVELRPLQEGEQVVRIHGQDQIVKFVPGNEELFVDYSSSHSHRVSQPSGLVTVDASQLEPDHEQHILIQNGTNESPSATARR